MVRSLPRRTLEARVIALLATAGTAGARSFRTSPVDSLDLGFDGIAGDRHGGLTRRSGAREPWYAKGTEIRNERQLSLLCPQELAAIAAGMGVERVEPEWLGGNIVLAGIPRLTLLPPRSLLMVDGGATIRIDGLNLPCRAAGRAVQAEYPDRPNLDLAFVSAARDRRGLVGFVERPGRIAVGDRLVVRVPEQRLYE
jgi:hypothetical protein